jgi:hypothetical protein
MDCSLVSDNSDLMDIRTPENGCGFHTVLYSAEIIMKRGFNEWI